MKSLTVLDIIRTHLDDTGMDGLVRDDAECSCLRSDLAPCGQIGSSCMAGRRVPCTCGEGCEAHIAAVGE